MIVSPAGSNYYPVCMCTYVRIYVPFQMYVMLDALADGGVYAGIPKEIGLRLIAHTMIVGTHCMYACK